MSRNSGALTHVVRVAIAFSEPGRHHAILAARDLPRAVTDLKRHTACQLLELLEAEQSSIRFCDNDVLLNQACTSRPRGRRSLLRSPISAWSGMATP